MASATVKTENIPVQIFKEQKTVVLTLTEYEAKVLSALCGDIGGSGPVRAVFSCGPGSNGPGIYEALQKVMGRSFRFKREKTIFMTHTTLKDEE